MLTIAIDGPAGAGKGTIARLLSERFNLKHLDTGLLYRETARIALKRRVPPDDAAKLVEIASAIDVDSLNASLLRDEEISALASKIAVLPEVRHRLTLMAREFAKNVAEPYRGAVLDGRDTAIAIIPDADVKFYVTADAEIRARRRALELNRDSGANEASVLKTMEERDNRDLTRKATPLRMAEGAIIVDTGSMSVEEVLAKTSRVVEAYLGRGASGDSSS